MTIATRGLAPDPFGGSVKRIHVDRKAAREVQAAVGKEDWDVVIDQLCYGPAEALIACKVFSGRVGRYVLTSTQAVYSSKCGLTESDFDPWSFPVPAQMRVTVDYAAGKRLAEAVFFQFAEFPLVAPRLPIVLGSDDYSGRLEFHIARIRAGQPIVVSNLAAKICFIHSAEAARFLEWSAEQGFAGPINGCSNGSVAMAEILRWIEEDVARKSDVRSTGEAKDKSPFGSDESIYMSNERASQLGFQFESLKRWMPELIAEISRRGL